MKNSHDHYDDTFIDPRRKVQELLRRFRTARRLTQEEVAARRGCSRITIQRSEGKYDGLPKKSTVAARSRFLKLLLKGYGLYRIEADEVLVNLRFDGLSDQEWRQLGRPVPHFPTTSHSRETGNNHQFQSMVANFGYYMINAQVAEAIAAAEELLGVAQQYGEINYLVDAHCAFGTALFHAGQLVRSREHLETAVQLHDTSSNRDHASFHAVKDPKVLAASLLSHVLYLLGDTEQALQMNDEVLNRTQSLSPSELGCIYFFTSAFYALMRDLVRSRMYAQSTVLLSSEFGGSHWAAKAGIIHGWIVAKEGHPEEGILEIQKNLLSLTQPRPHLAQPIYLSWLADAHRLVGHPEEALAVLVEARGILEKTGERVWEPFLHLTEGHIHCQMASDTAAERSYRQAVDTACQIGANALQLRAITNLSLIWRDQGRMDESRNALEVILGQFEMGLGTPDLVEAQSVLASLY